MKKWFSLLILLPFLACNPPSPMTIVDPATAIIPRPAVVRAQTGHFTFDDRTSIRVQGDAPALLGVAETLADWLQQAGGLSLSVSTERGDGAANVVSLALSDTIESPEGYTLSITGTRVEVRGRTAQGVFYALQTLRQLLPPAAETGSESLPLTLPAVQIEDAPRYGYRGMHLDVCRHFFSVETIKRYLDLLALHKYNTFHWHLTEDQGWRIEIKKYPKLTEVGAWRKETLVGHYSDQPHQFDGKPYGGFYTQEEVREIGDYAAARFITVIPEIELPGHSLAALAAYPELGCTEGPFEVATKWGVFEDVYCPTETTFQFLEDVLTEVMDLFPSRYIHIGGDECPKKRWEESAFCQQLIREKGLKDTHGLQSYFIQRIERFVNEKGRSIIGWDEILEGGLAPNATVMSWRGIAGGIEAARQGHDVIMTPTSSVYFDYYQGDPEDEPLAIGGLITLEKVYAFEPTPPELSEAEARHVLGGQANTWTEYIPTPEYLDYMTWPRATALAEVLWSQQDQRDWADFSTRLPRHLDRLEALGVHYAPRFYDVSGETLVDPDRDQLSVALSVFDNSEIRYTLDGTTPTAASALYTGPVAITDTGTIQAASFEQGELRGRPWRRKHILHKAIGKEVSLTFAPSEQYTGRGPYGLVNGIHGSKGFGGGHWTGFNGEDLEAVIDLGAPTEVSRVVATFLHNSGAWIFLPTEMEVSLSDDGATWRSVGSFANPETALEATLAASKDNEVRFAPVHSRYIKIHARSLGACPVWHGGAGNPCWLFVDEIVVE